MHVVIVSACRTAMGKQSDGHDGPRTRVFSLSYPRRGSGYKICASIHLEDKSGWDSSSSGKFLTWPTVEDLKESETTVQAIPV
jgi:hypothetical protein